MMNFKDFSYRLITTQDLDPDYLFLREILNGEPLFNKITWLQHKVFIYDTASEYNHLMRNVPLDSLRYGAERNKNRNRTYKQLPIFLEKFKLEDMPKEYTEARRYLKEFPGMGDWASWKFCDLLERVADVEIDFSKVDFREAYDFPLRGLCRVNGQTDDFVATLKKNDDLYHHYIYNAQHILGTDVMELEPPPKKGRTVNIQEIETCLCKYHSYLSGHYTIGKDTLHLYHRLKAENIYPGIVKYLLIHHKAQPNLWD